MEDNCGEWIECMGVASGCGEQEAGVASGIGWNLWVWLLDVLVRRYRDFLILFIPTSCIYSAGYQESRKCIFSLNVHFLSHTSCY